MIQNAVRVNALVALVMTVITLAGCAVLANWFFSEELSVGVVFVAFAAATLVAVFVPMLIRSLATNNDDLLGGTIMGLLIIAASGAVIAGVIQSTLDGHQTVLGELVDVSPYSEVYLPWCVYGASLLSYLINTLIQIIFGEEP